MAAGKRDFRGEAVRELEHQDASRRWVEARVQAIRQWVSAYDVLRRFGVPLKGSTEREEQFSCPFHGTRGDRRPSARVYPTTVRGPSHAWCFVCQERWDVITLWKKFNGTEEHKFTRVLAEIERAFGITPPEAPPANIEDVEDPELVEVDMLLGACERRLKLARNAFDMKSYLTIGSILDRIYYQVDEGLISYLKAKGILQKIQDKITERERQCLGD